MGGIGEGVREGFPPGFFIFKASFPLGFIKLHQFFVSVLSEKALFSCASRHISKCTEFGTIKIRIVEHLPFTKVLNRAFQTEPTEYDVLLQLASCHIC